ncbi:Dirigent protein 19, partial [Cucurbita argyrosperma subsp. argyrosperma]
MATKLIILCLLLSVLGVTATGPKVSYARKMDPKTLKMDRHFLLHFHLYWHDTVSGAKPSSVAVLPPRNKATVFGELNLFDNPLTIGPEPSSRRVGRSQGMYAGTASDQIGLMMGMTFAFTTGKYNGSSFTVFGRNAITEHEREMPVVGGTGKFRFARGYALAKTHHLNPDTFDAVVEYDIYVLHY